MSSHHIIRDQQEPAVLIHRMEQFPVQVLHSLLEWSPTVLCCESSVDLYTQQGFKLDVGLISHLNYEYWKKKLKKQYPIKLMGIQDSQFLMTGLTFLKKDNHKGVNIVSDELSLFEVIRECLFWSRDLEIVVLTETRRHVLQRSLIYKKWLPAFSSVSVMPLAGRSYFSTLGFDNDLENEWLQEGLTLNKRGEGEILIKSSEAPFLVSENL